MLRKNKHFIAYKIFILFILHLSFTNCTPFLKVSPIPKHSKNIDAELKYIFKTDQKDRRRILMTVLFQSEEKYMKNHKVLAVSDRDSIRLRRVILLDKSNLIKSDQASFYAGVIYLHKGGIKMINDSLYLIRSSELFENVMRNSTNNKLKKRAEVYYKEAQNQIEWNKRTN